MNIIWLSWKDIRHPFAGGAETVSDEIRKNLVKDGHRVTLITSKPRGLPDQEILNGINVIRAGGKYSVYFKAYKIYRNNFYNSADIVIDEMNTIPFFAGLYASKKSEKYLLTYQLARNVWFYQMVFPLSLVGYLIEPLYLRMLSNKYNKVITESQSTKNDLIKNGYKKANIQIFRVGMNMKPVNKISTNKKNTIIFLGSFRKMKRTLDAIKAFEFARKSIPDLKLTLIGDSSGSYGKKIINYIEDSKFKKDINYLGRVSLDIKKQKLFESKIILVTSVKEGWGLIITEANSQGTPAIAYDVDGLRDSVKNGVTGILVSSGNYNDIGLNIISLIDDSPKLQQMSKNSWNDSKRYTFKNSYIDFKNILGL